MSGPALQKPKGLDPFRNYQPYYSDSVHQRVRTRLADDGTFSDESLGPAYEAEIERDKELFARCVLPWGYPESDLGEWDLAFDAYTTRQCVRDMGRAALMFHAARIPAREAFLWDSYFSSPTWSITYRHAGRRPRSAYDVFRAVKNVYYFDWWNDERLLEAHDWTLTRIPARRVARYLRLGVGVREALTDWEPLPDRDPTLAVMDGLLRST